MRLIPAFAVLCLVPLVAPAAGEIYRWKDTTGVWHYSDQPQPGAELVKSTRKPAATQASTQGSQGSTSTASSVLPASSPLSDSVTQQVRDEAAAAKSDQCKKAIEAYDKSIQARRMFRVDDQGNQVFLNNDELDQARLNARSARDLACGPQ
jgi:hypothetical protein